MKRVDYEKAWKRSMVELNKSIKFHECHAGKYDAGVVRLKEFRETMKKIRKQGTGGKDENRS